MYVADKKLRRSLRQILSYAKPKDMLENRLGNFDQTIFIALISLF